MIMRVIFASTPGYISYIRPICIYKHAAFKLEHYCRYINNHARKINANEFFFRFNERRLNSERRTTTTNCRERPRPTDLRENLHATMITLQEKE